MAESITQLSESETAQVSAKVPLQLKEELNRIAYLESSPSRRVTPSEVIRRALAEHVEKYDEDAAEIEGRT